jgi:hypothetical protein
MNAEKAVSGSCSAGADDCQVQLLWLEQFGSPVCTKEGIKQPLMEPFGLVRAVQQDYMLANARSAEGEHRQQDYRPCLTADGVEP